MSAAEVIEMIKRLPPEERAEVIAFTLGESAATPLVDAPEYLPQAEAERVAERVFAENHELFRRLAQ